MTLVLRILYRSLISSSCFHCFDFWCIHDHSHVFPHHHHNLSINCDTHSRAKMDDNNQSSRTTTHRLTHQLTHTLYMHRTHVHTRSHSNAIIATATNIQGLVAVVGPRSAATVVAMVAAIKRGNAFMLVDDELPSKRIQLMGTAARPAVVRCATNSRVTFLRCVDTGHDC